jgi:hypothetical protein
MDAYGQKKDIPIKEYFDIKKGDEIYVEYCILEVISVVHDIEEETVYYRCQNKE